MAMWGDPSLFIVSTLQNPTLVMELMSVLIGDSRRELQIVPGPLIVANLLLPGRGHQPSLARLPPVKKRSVEY